MKLIILPNRSIYLKNQFIKTCIHESENVINNFKILILIGIRKSNKNEVH